MDDNALSAALKDGRIRAAALDVHTGEPFGPSLGKFASIFSIKNLNVCFCHYKIKLMPLI